MAADPPKSPPPAPKRSSGGRIFKVVLTIMLLSGALVALAWYTWGLRKRHEKTSGELTKTTAAQKECSTKLDAEKRHSGDLDKLLAACTTESNSVKTKGAADEKVNAALSENLKASRTELDELRKQRADSERRLAAFQALTAKFQKMIDTGTLRVRVRNGRMLVELPAGVLFGSGKAELSDKGNAALTAVAGVLKELGDRHFLVAGHTDSDPIKDSPYSDNWELSVARALRVVKYLISAGMPAGSLAAAGYAEFDPAAKNKSKKGKQLNRRIEIVLEPRIDELPKLPESESSE